MLYRAREQSNVFITRKCTVYLCKTLIYSLQITVYVSMVLISQRPHMYKYIHVSFHYKVVKQLEIRIKCKENLFWK